MSKISALNHQPNDGGLAFPGRRSEQVGNVSDHGFTFEGEDSPTYGDVEHPGMSLRDWFAGQAIGAIIERCGGDTRARYEHLHDYFARKAYEISDALLMARTSSSSIQEKSE